MSAATFSCLIEIAALRRALDAAATVLPARPTIPILGHVRLESGGDGRLKLTATDTDRAIEIEVPVVEVTGATTLPGRALREVLKRFADGCQVAIEADAQSAQVRGGRGRTRLPTLPAADYPPIPRPKTPATEIRIDGKTLAGLFDRIAYAASTDHVTRNYACGAYLHVRRGDDGVFLRAVATDGFRLHWREAAPADLTEGAKPVIVPTESLTAIAKLAAGAGEVALTHDAHRLTLELPDVTFTTRLIDASYPDYARICPAPAETPVVATLDREQFARAIDAALSVATDKGRQIRVAIAEDRVTVDRDDGDYEVEMSVEAEAHAVGEPAFPYLFGANGQFLAATLAAVGGDTIDIRLLAGDGRIHLSRHGKADEPGEYALVMPQRLKNGSSRVAAEAAPVGSPKRNAKVAA